MAKKPDGDLDRKRFMREVYSHYWLRARETKYGFMDYDRLLCDMLSDLAPERGKLLEVAIGTGYPIADALSKRGFEIHGVDISPALIERCHTINPAIHAKVGDADNLEFDDGEFDAAYCFHSTWYFPDITRVIDGMTRVTRADGFIAFDIQNRTNPAIAAEFDRRRAQVRPGLGPRLALHARNVAKVVLRRGNPNWHGLIYEVPTDPRTIYDHLGGRGFRVLDPHLNPLSGPGTFPEYPRLVFIVGNMPVSAEPEGAQPLAASVDPPEERSQPEHHSGMFP
jgi:SAM-dependent methyltransferase